MILPMEQAGTGRRRVLVVLPAFALGLVLALGFGPQGIEFPTTPTGGVPWGLHLSFTQDPATTMTVTWFTYSAQSPASFVEYGSSPVRLGNRTDADSWSVPGREDLWGHSASVTDLKPGGSFHYRVGGETGWSDVWQTETAPGQGPYRILLFADQGVSPAARMVARDMQEADADLVLIAGDLAYAEDEPRLWDEWFQMNQPLFATTPMMPAIGNHDLAGPEGAAAYTSRLSLPGDETAYSFTYARTHILSLDTSLPPDPPDDPDPQMVEFARNELERAAARRAAGEIDHILILQHNPIYSNVERADRHVRHDLVSWEEPLLVQYDVDLLLAGHNHHYERSYPLANGTATTSERTHYTDPEGWIQVISGGGGRSLYDFRPLEEFQPITAAHERAHHYILIEVDGPTAHVEATAAGIHARTGSFDTFTVTRSPGPAGTGT